MPQDTQKNNTNETAKKVRLLTIKRLDDSPVNLQSFKHLYKLVIETNVITGGCPACELIERGCALIFLLIIEGGTTAPSPVKKIEKLRINTENVRNGFVRWTPEGKSPASQKQEFGPRQFLYTYSQLHLLSFLQLRLEELTIQFPRIQIIQANHTVLPEITKGIYSEAKKELKWLKNVKQNPSWTAVFTAYIKHQLSKIDSNFDVNTKISIPALREAAFVFLYNSEEPVLLEARRGEITYAPMPDRQFQHFLPLIKQSIKPTKRVLSIKEQTAFEEAEEYCLTERNDKSLGEGLAFKPDKGANTTYRDLAVKELRNYLNTVTDAKISFPEAVNYGESLLRYKLFSAKNSAESHHLLRWLIERFKEGKKKGNTISTIATHAQRLFYITDSLGMMFSELTTNDVILFLSQYSEASAAQNYLSTFKIFHNYLNSDPNITLQNIDWKSPGLRFSKSFREFELITESQFQLLLSNSRASTLLNEHQMMLVLLLMRRAGLRCSEISLLKFVDFTSLSQLRLSINFSKSAAGRRDLPLHILLSDLELQLFLDYYKPVFFASLSDLRVLYKPFMFDRNGILLSPEQIGAEVAKVIKAAGLEMQTAHKLRHAFASSLLAAWWLRKTESKFTNSFRKDDWARQALHQFCRPEVEGRAITYLDDIRGLMGHASLDVTFDRYIHNVDLITADAVRAGEFLETPRKINVGLAADLAGVTTRELRRVIPADNREKSDLDKRMVEIDTEKFKNWLINRLK